jgi:hypothetical protein
MIWVSVTFYPFTLTLSPKGERGYYWKEYPRKKNTFLAGAVAILAFYGTGGAASLPLFQMAGLTLAMKGIFQVQHTGSRMNLMAVLTFLHRQTPAPDIAATGKIMMAGGAVQAGGLVGLVPKEHRTLGARLKFVALQGAYRLRHRGAEGFGAQKHDDGRGQKKYPQVSR